MSRSRGGPGAEGRVLGASPRRDSQVLPAERCRRAAVGLKRARHCSSAIVEAGAAPRRPPRRPGPLAGGSHMQRAVLRCDKAARFSPGAGPRSGDPGRAG